MFENPTYIASVFSTSEFPKERLPEVVLCGRSNVGKSSFINCLFNRKNLAKTSSTPGKTRSINYYNIDSKFYMVDLPGYGYAKVSQSERKKWGNLVNDFFANSNYINLTIHIIDSRYKPTELDIKLNNMLRLLNIPFIILLNKSDRLKQSEYSKAVRSVKKLFPEVILYENLFFFSSIKGTGCKEIKKLLAALFY